MGGRRTLVSKELLEQGDRRVINRLHQVAAAIGIALQPGVYAGFGSDGAALMRSGVPTAHRSKSRPAQGVRYGAIQNPALGPN